MIKFNFGDTVFITEKYKRIHKTSEKNEEYREWTRVKYRTNGLFLGLRTLKNGRVDCDQDEGWSFVAKEYIRVALVCPGPNLNSVYVPIGSIFEVKK